MRIIWRYWAFQRLVFDRLDGDTLSPMSPWTGRWEIVNHRYWGQEFWWIPLRDSFYLETSYTETDAVSGEIDGKSMRWIGYDGWLWTVISWHFSSLSIMVCQTKPLVSPFALSCATYLHQRTPPRVFICEGIFPHIQVVEKQYCCHLCHRLEVAAPQVARCDLDGCNGRTIWQVCSFASSF